ncbi:MAG: alpha/beta hydrolase [Geminicoccaceae bacterium]
MPSGDFAAYVAAAKAAIADANQALERPLAAAVIEDRAPFELVPDPRRCPPSADGRHPKAALLLHGLGGSPYEMRDLGRALVEACYLVRAILLPGHGTVPGDLLDVDDQEWVQATRLAIASFERKAERLVLVGFGVGATLALHAALLDQPPPGPELVGAVLLSPALGTGAPPAWLRAPALYGDLLPAARWSRLLADGDPVRYESMPHHAELQRARLIAALDAREEPLQLPVYVAISASDAEFDPGAARDWFCRRLSGPRRLIWYTPAPAGDTGCQFVVERASAATTGILDLSHVALPIAPDNPRYGAEGAYLDCSHYYWEVDTPSWFICMDPSKTAANSKVRQGEITEANLQRHVVRRLTYNPDFEAMVEDLLAFLADPGWPQGLDVEVSP